MSARHRVGRTCFRSDRAIRRRGRRRHLFNLNSPKQLGEILFDRLHLIEKPKKTKTGQYQTNEEVLPNSNARPPHRRAILDYREATKFKSTYVDALPQAVFPRTGRVHTTFLQLMTATGRLASNNPNLQNIPIRTPWAARSAAPSWPAAGHELLSADYSQIELRVMAALSGDQAMIEAFLAGHDIHTATAVASMACPWTRDLPTCAAPPRW
jgi:DNA polymerase I